MEPVALLPALGAAGLLLWVALRAVAQPANRLLHAPTPANEELLAACPALRSYAPTPYLPGPHLNSASSVYMRAPPRAPGGGRFAYAARTRLPVSHGGAVHLDWHTRPAAGQPVLLLLHGLTGGSHECYVQWMVHHAATAGGLACVVLNARGCGNSQLTSPRSFSGAWTEDVRAVVRHLRALVGAGTAIFAAGYSLGAGILSKYVGEEGAACDLAGAVSVSAAFDLLASSAMLERGLSRLLYNGMLANALLRYYRKHRAQLDTAPWAQPAAVAAATTVRQFDAAAIAPQFGYRDAEHYYADASAGPLLQLIRVPFLALNAHDDPICDVTGLLERAAVFAANPHLLGVVTREGGHVSWATGWGPTLGLAWDNVATLQWIQALLARRGGGVGGGGGSGGGGGAPAPPPLDVASAGASLGELPVARGGRADAARGSLGGVS